MPTRSVSRSVNWRSPPNVYRGAVQYKGTWLAPGSQAFQLYQDKKFKELEQLMKAVADKERAGH